MGYKAKPANPGADFLNIFSVKGISDLGFPCSAFTFHLGSQVTKKSFSGKPGFTLR